MGYHISKLMNLPDHFKLYFFLVGRYRNHSPINDFFTQDFSIIAERIGDNAAIISRNADIEFALLDALKASKKVADVTTLENIRFGSPALIILDQNALHSIKHHLESSHFLLSRGYSSSDFSGDVSILLFEDLELAYPNTNMLLRDISEFAHGLNHNLIVRTQFSKQSGSSMVYSDPGLYSADGLCLNIQRALTNIQSNPLYRGCLENEVNDALRDNLSMVYCCMDQTRRGISESGQGSGELDLLVFDDNRMPLALIEALRLNSVDSTQLQKHIHKALNEYNAPGLRHIFLCVYYTSANFHGFWDRLLRYLQNYDFQFPILVPLTDVPYPHTEVHHAKTLLATGHQSVHVHFYAIHLPS